MKTLKKLTCCLMVAAMLFTTACSAVEDGDKNSSLTQSSQKKPTTSLSSTTKPATTTEKSEIPAVELNYTKFKKVYNAADGEFFGNVNLSTNRKGYSDKKGCAAGFTDPATDDWSIKVTLPETQYYDFTLSVGADKKVTNSLLVDGVVLETFTVNKISGFKKITFENVYMQKGEYTISFGLLDGEFFLDRLEISANDEISKLDLTLEYPALSNTSPSENAEKLYDLICSLYGKNILSGQYVSMGSNAEIAAIYDKTGKHPAIRFSDLLYYTADEGVFADEISPALEWWENGGIVGFSWHWAAPMNEGSFYSSETEFDLSKAVTEMDISTLDFSRIAELCDERAISEECLEIVRDIDLIAENLRSFRDRDVPVLFRPLHEASGGWFWWGCDPDSYKWLWELLYKRFTDYHNLDNLIWVWNAQNPAWYVGDKYCDIISADIYSAASTDRQINAFLSLNKVSDSKPVALSECDTLPSATTLSRDKTFWSYFSFWCGDYIIDSDGKLNQENISNDALVNLYNNTVVLTREDFIELWQP
ncbi:MAG: glycoside hydrolase [Ruminococcus sp.]|nr:glycoside hydrolase [Ruminococcus sp.]